MLQFLNLKLLVYLAFAGPGNFIALLPLVTFFLRHHPGVANFLSLQARDERYCNKELLRAGPLCVVEATWQYKMQYKRTAN